MSPIVEPRPIAERLTAEAHGLPVAAFLLELVDDPGTPVTSAKGAYMRSLVDLGCVAGGKVTALGERVAVLLRRMGVGEDDAA